MKICSLASGSKGNLIYIGYNNTNLLVDFGISTKEAEIRLASIGVRPESIDAILITHEHKDHIKGVELFAKKYGVDVYAYNGTWDLLDKTFKEINLKKRIDFFLGDFFLGELTVVPFKVSHDASACVGFSFIQGSNKISVATDLGFVCESAINNLKGSDIVLIESNHCAELLHMGKYPYFLKRRVSSREGHLSNEDAAVLNLELAKSGTKQIILAHLSAENNRPELAYKTTANLLEAGGAVINKDVYIDIAFQDKKTALFEVV